MLSFFQSKAFLTAVKVILAAGFGWYLFGRLSEIDWTNIHLASNSTSSWQWVALGFVGLSVINWTTDTWLWWNIARQVTPLPFFRAFKINLISHAVGLMTPANLGEYGIKALQFSESADQKQSVFLTFSYRFSKTYVKTAMGLLAGYFLWTGNSPIAAWTCLIGLLIASIGFYYFPAIMNVVSSRPWLLRLLRLSPDSNWNFKKLKIRRSILPALIKFASYSGQLALILTYWSGANGWSTWWRSTAVYSLGSYIPTLSVFDPVVKTSLGDVLFTPIGIPIETIALGTGMVWIMNMGLPSIIGYTLWLGWNHHSKST